MLLFIERNDYGNLFLTRTVIACRCKLYCYYVLAYVTKITTPKNLLLLLLVCFFSFPHRTFTECW